MLYETQLDDCNPGRVLLLSIDVRYYTKVVNNTMSCVQYLETPDPCRVETDLVNSFRQDYCNLHSHMLIIAPLSSSLSVVAAQSKQTSTTPGGLEASLDHGERRPHSCAQVSSSRQCTCSEDSHQAMRHKLLLYVLFPSMFKTFLVCVHVHNVVK